MPEDLKRAQYNAARRAKRKYAGGWSDAERAYYERNKERIKANRATNMQRVLETAKARYKANPSKVREASSKWRAANREKSLAINRAYMQRIYTKSPEEMRARSRADYAANKETRRESHGKWLAANPTAKRIYESRRRARKRGALEKYTANDVERILKLQQRKCPVCIFEIGEKYEIDHIMPLALGGENTPRNIQILHVSCNRSKHARHPVEFMRSKGFLL